VATKEVIARVTGMPLKAPGVVEEIDPLLGDDLLRCQPIGLPPPRCDLLLRCQPIGLPPPRKSPLCAVRRLAAASEMFLEQRQIQLVAGFEAADLTRADGKLACSCPLSNTADTALPGQARQACRSGRNIRTAGQAQNGKAGGKQPSGKRAPRSPLRILSEAIRKAAAKAEYASRRAFRTAIAKAWNRGAGDFFTRFGWRPSTSARPPFGWHLSAEQ
jgi:hypothetical protein